MLYEAATIGDIYLAYEQLKIDDNSLYSCIGIAGVQAGEEILGEDICLYNEFVLLTSDAYVIFSKAMLELGKHNGKERKQKRKNLKHYKILGESLLYYILTLHSIFKIFKINYLPFSFLLTFISFRMLRFEQGTGHFFS